jgi:hypothetical protein
MTDRFDSARRITQEMALQRLLGTCDERFAEVFRHGSMQIEAYVPVVLRGCHFRQKYSLLS